MSIRSNTEITLSTDTIKVCPSHAKEKVIQWYEERKAADWKVVVSTQNTKIYQRIAFPDAIKIYKFF